MKGIPVLGTLLIICFSCLFAQKKKTDTNIKKINNPILQGYFADPTIIKVNGVFYIYATIDPWGAEELGVFETKDFITFTQRHLNWPTKKVCTSPTSHSANVWAPCVVKGNNKKFYMYVAVGNEIWAGVADHPLGPWKNSKPDNTPLVAYGDFAANKVHNIDPDCYIDDDGSAYLYWGSGFNWVNGHCMAVKLKKDMYTFDGNPVDITPAHYFEAPNLIKRKGTYYLMFSEGKAIDSTYRIRYAVSKSPLGPFVEGSNNPILATIPGTPVIGPGHHTVFQEKGQDYILYHRIFPQKKNYVLRQLCVDTLKFDRDGNILPVTPKGITSFTN